MSNAMSNPEYESWLQVSAGAADSRALQLCPFCGGKAAFVPRAVNLALQKDPSDPKFGVSVICGKCASESPNMVDEAHAAAKWNSRTPDVNEARALVDAGWRAAVDCHTHHGMAGWSSHRSGYLESALHEVAGPDRAAGVHDGDQDSVAEWEREESARNALWIRADAAAREYASWLPIAAGGQRE
jgi:Lar family restriction alleviation protein